MSASEVRVTSSATSMSSSGPTAGSVVRVSACRNCWAASSGPPTRMASLPASMRGQQGGPVVLAEPRVTGQLGGGAGGAAGAQHLGVRRVQADPLAGQQVVVDRLSEQGVPEGVGVGARGHQHVGLDGGAHRGLECRRPEVADLGEQVVGDVAAGHGGDPHHLPGLVVEPVEPVQQHVGEVPGHAPAARRDGPDELLDEERVALGAGHDVGDLGLAHRVGVQPVDQAAHVPGQQRLELHPLDAGQPGPLADLAAQRVAAVQVVGAVGHDEGDPGGEGAAEEEAEHVAGGLVGPVGVLDHHEERTRVGGPLEEGVHGVEEVAALEGLVVGTALGVPDPPTRLQPAQGGVGVEHLLDEVGVGEREAAEDLGEGQVGEAVVGQVEAVTGGDLPAVVDDEVTQLGQQPGLADARVAAEQHGARGALGRTDAELGAQGIQLGITADQVGTSQSGHGRHHVACHRHRRPEFPGRRDGRAHRAATTAPGRTACEPTALLGERDAPTTRGPVLPHAVGAVLDLCVQGAVGEHVPRPFSW